MNDFIRSKFETLADRLFLLNESANKMEIKLLQQIRKKEN